MMLHKEEYNMTEKEKLLAFVNSLSQKEVEAIVANFAEIVATLSTNPLPDPQGRPLPDQ